ncbi:MAG: hypothetical protein KDB53_06175, partial [Planctomycetes bacterium]|nr:hypothetical protein [Planctomycetota bacterium]
SYIPAMSRRSEFLRSMRFALERWVQRGVFHQLLMMVGVIVVVAVGGGMVAWWLGCRRLVSLRPVRRSGGPSCG